MRLVVYIGIENLLAIRLFKFEDLNEEKKNFKITFARGFKSFVKDV